MEQILTRNLPPGTKAALQARAKRHNHSVEAEARAILTAAVSGEEITIVDLLADDSPDGTSTSSRSASL
jgi:plasmid stability protein